MRLGYRTWERRRRGQRGGRAGPGKQLLPAAGLLLLQEEEELLGLILGLKAPAGSRAPAGSLRAERGSRGPQSSGPTKARDGCRGSCRAGVRC